MSDEVKPPDRIWIDKGDLKRAGNNGVGSFFFVPYSDGEPDDSSIEYVPADSLTRAREEAAATPSDYRRGVEDAANAVQACETPSYKDYNDAYLLKSAFRDGKRTSAEAIRALLTTEVQGAPLESMYFGIIEKFGLNYDATQPTGTLERPWKIALHLPGRCTTATGSTVRQVCEIAHEWLIMRSAPPVVDTVVDEKEPK